jgi:hypothetical protein
MATEATPDRELRAIDAEMDVCDREGNKIGKVAHVLQDTSLGDVVEVKTGLFGLGKHYYIPLGEVRDVTEGGVFLSRGRGEIDLTAWEAKPAAAAPAGAAAAFGPAAGAPPAPGEADWGTVMPHYRARWEERYGQHGAGWEAYEARYRFAWEMGNRPELSEQTWYAAQPRLREEWGSRSPDTSWDQASDAVRDAWEHRPGDEPRASS